MRLKKKRAIQMTLVDAMHPAEPTTPDIDVDEIISSMEKSTITIMMTGAVAYAGLLIIKTACKIAENNLSN